MVIAKRFLVLPISRYASRTKICFFENGSLVFDLDVRLDNINPQYYAYYDMRNFLGRDIEIEHEWMKNFDFCDKAENGKAEPYRPLAHFTAGSGWLNDPNGLVYYEGNYHMFFQYNPVGTGWGNMHWGHAVSKDLIEWKEQEIALFPDDMGDMYSGSAVIDKDNLLGLKNGEHDTVVLFYTAAGGVRKSSAGRVFTQCIAYSTDGMKTFEKYNNNPIINHIKGENRDPKVVYHNESKMYVMVLYLHKGEYGFFKSSNLTDWEFISSYFHDGDRECPDFYHINDKFVFVGANDFYAVGDFDINKGFYNVTKPVRFGFGDNYASQSFFGTDKVIRICWNRFTNYPAARFNCAMGIPCEVTLEENILKLKPYVCEENKIIINNAEKNFKTNLEPGAYDIRLKLDADGEITVFGNKILLKNEKLYIKDLTGKTNEMPSDFDIRIIVDKVGVEVFSSGGRYFGAFCAVSDYNMNYLYVEKGAEKIEINRLK